MTDIITRSVWLNKKLLYSSNKIFANLNEQNKNWFSCDFCFNRKFLCHIAGNVKRKYIYYPLLSFVFKNWIILNKIMIFVYQKKEVKCKIHFNDIFFHFVIWSFHSKTYISFERFMATYSITEQYNFEKSETIFLSPFLLSR